MLPARPVGRAAVHVAVRAAVDAAARAAVHVAMRVAVRTAAHVAVRAAARGRRLLEAANRDRRTPPTEHRFGHAHRVDGALYLVDPDEVGAAQDREDRGREAAIHPCPGSRR